MIKKSETTKYKNQNNIGACRIEIAKQESDNARADQSARFKCFSVKGNTSFDQRPKQSGARQCKKGKAEDALDADHKGRTQKVLKRAGQEGQRQKKRGDADQADNGIGRIGAKLARKVMRRWSVRHKARKRRVLR